jgi:hypothetical protein
MRPNRGDRQKQEDKDKRFAERLSQDGPFGDDHDAGIRYREFFGILLQVESNRVSLRDPDAFIYNGPIQLGVPTHIDPIH